MPIRQLAIDPASLPYADLEAILRRDPGMRGLGTYETQHGPFLQDQLAKAAASLATSATHVAIVTGFYIPSADPPAAETDGPPGTLYLARLLAAIGCQVTIISDAYGLPLVAAGLAAGEPGECRLLEFPFEAGEPEDEPRAGSDLALEPRTAAFVDALLADTGDPFSHVISIERAGPSHTPVSIQAQYAANPTEAAARLQLFLEEVAPLDQDRCHNMRARLIHGHTAKTHRLFEAIAARRPQITTIGVGDGGNEIGLGRVPWHLLRSAIATGPGATIACRIATDCTLTAGVSNYGGYALALCIAALVGRLDKLAAADCAAEARLIERIVCDAGAVDGVIGKPAPSVDGLPLDIYLQTLAELRRVYGLPA